MTDRAGTSAGMTRADRLAAQLRANLRRRKQQARAISQEQASDGHATPTSQPDGDPAINPTPDKPLLAKPRNDG